MRIISILTFVLFFSCFSIHAEDGSALWLRYPTGAKAIIMNKKQSPTLNIAVSELRNFWQGGIPITLEIQKNKELRALGNDGYIIRASKDGNHLTITSSVSKEYFTELIICFVCKLPDNYPNQH